MHGEPRRGPAARLSPRPLKRDEIVIIKITRSGGFAGVVEELGTIDTSSLGADAAAQVRDRVAKLERLGAAARDQPIGADMFRYEIEIEDEEGRHRRLVLTHEGDPSVPLPEPLGKLLSTIEGYR